MPQNVDSLLVRSFDSCEFRTLRKNRHL